MTIMSNEIKEEMYKHLNGIKEDTNTWLFWVELKGNSTKHLNEIKKTNTEYETGIQ
jgi:hypothetical protein